MLRLWERNHQKVFVNGPLSNGAMIIVIEQKNLTSWRAVWYDPSSIFSACNAHSSRSDREGGGFTKCMVYLVWDELWCSARTILQNCTFKIESLHHGWSFKCMLSNFGGFDVAKRTGCHKDTSFPVVFVVLQTSGLSELLVQLTARPRCARWTQLAYVLSASECDLCLHF